MIVGIKYAVYLISFIHHGLKEIGKDDPQPDEIMPENAGVAVETQSDAELLSTCCSETGSSIL